MSEQTKSIAEHVRTVLSARPEQAHTYADVHSALREQGVGPERATEAIQQALRYLKNCGFANKVGMGACATFQATGKGMQRPRVGREESGRRRRERDRVRHQARRAAPPRERRVDANTVARPKAKKAEASNGPAMTVEEFKAAGGVVERLTTHWEQMERAA
jgi:hypothetical protein